MTLEPTFSLTPRSSYYYAASDNRAQIYCHGPSFFPIFNSTYRYSFDHQHANDELFFYSYAAADPSVDYAIWANRQQVPHIRLYSNLSAFGANKELALVFGFDASSDSRLLVYSDAGLLDDVTLVAGDNQFLMEVEGVESALDLYFIHSRQDGSDYGGHWFFRGITGYVI